MDITAFLIIFSVLEVCTPLLTEAVKKFLKSISVAYIGNVATLIVAVFLSVFAMTFYSLYAKIELTPLYAFYCVFMALANWCGSMVGYDKVKQIIDKFKKV